MQRAVALCGELEEKLTELRQQVQMVSQLKNRALAVTTMEDKWLTLFRVAKPPPAGSPSGGQVCGVAGCVCVSVHRSCSYWSAFDVLGKRC